MTIRKIVTLLMAMALLGLSGCQTTSFSSLPASANDVIIKHTTLTHLSSDAQVSVELNYKGGHRDRLDEIVIERLPHVYRLSDGDLSGLETIQVKVKIGNQIQLQGQSGGTVNNIVELSEVSAQPLLNTFWKAKDISGRGIPLSVKTTLAVLDNGKLSGHAGCNQYRSGFNYSAAFIQIQAPLLTRKICSAPVMFHENRYLQLLQSAEYFQIDSEGMLNLYLQDNLRPIVFEPTSQDVVSLSMTAHKSS